MIGKAYEASKFGIAKRNRKGSFYSCEICKREFYVTPSRIQMTEAKGVRIRFCSNSCYDIGKRGAGNPMWGRKHSKKTIAKLISHPNRRRFMPGKDNPNAIRFGLLPNRKSGNARWRKYIRETTTELKCERCGYCEHPAILAMHHKDRNRKNNVRENLEILCPNCHEIDHFLAGDGRYGIAARRRKWRPK